MGAADDPMRFYEMLRDFLCEHLVVRRRLSAATVRDYRTALDQYRIWLRKERGVTFDRVGFGHFARGVVYDHLTWLLDDAGRSPATANLRLAAIKSFMHYCADEDATLMPAYLDVRSIHSFRGGGDGRLEYLTQPQLEALFAHPDTDTPKGRRNQYFMIHAYETGGRVAELVGMTVGDVRREGGRVTVRLHGKGDKVRHNPLPSQVVPHLDAYLGEFHPGLVASDPLFYTVHDGKRTPMAPRTVNSFLSKYASELHEEDPTFPEDLHCHVLRHSIGMAMYKKKVPLSYIKDFLGHAKIESTFVYAHADDETLDEALESIDQDALPTEGPGGETVGPEKKWKGREEYLLRLCGLI
jgi:site-specific recombinase XerD